MLEWIADYRVLEPLDDPAWAGTRIVAASPARLGLGDEPVIVELVAGEPGGLVGWVGRWAGVAARVQGLVAPIEVGPPGGDLSGSFVSRRAPERQRAPKRNGAPGPAAFAGAAEGLVGLHAEGIVHGCITPARIVATARGGLLDLPPTDASSGALVVLAPSADALDTIAPEVLRGEQPGPAADLWALGACIVRAVGGRAAHPGIDGDVLLAGVARIGRDRPDASAVRGPLAEVVEGCLRLDPDDRPDARTVASTLRAHAGAAA